MGRAFFLPPKPWVDEHGKEHGAQTELAEGDWKCTIPLCLTAVGCIALFIYAPELRDLLLPAVTGGAR